MLGDEDINSRDHLSRKRFHHAKDSITQKIPFTRSSLATDAAKRTTFQSP
ncbi:hypothetical protein HMPREF1992_00013 [Selenomonas sp. oral taxon 892 str. F0426]|nr:hypothetical protein HMPREF1992_00013 [Selenomonas sp. oral taxon 892 str. F0426]